GGGGQFVAVFLCLVFDDGDEFGGVVVLEQQGAGEAGGQAGVGGDEAAHVGGGAGGDDDDVVAVVLHHFDQGGDRFEAEVGAACGGDEGVGLIDEQDAAQGAGEGGGGFGAGVADVFADQVAAVDFDEVADAEHVEGFEQASVEAGDGGFAGAG